MTPNVRNGTKWLGAVAVALAAAAAARGSIFDALPHLKKPQKPICTHYGDCYGHFSPTYRVWPAHCVVNPPMPVPAKPVQQELPPPDKLPKKPTLLPLPLPIPSPEKPATPVPPAKDARQPSDGAVPGFLMEIEEDAPPARPAPR